MRILQFDLHLDLLVEGRDGRREEGGRNPVSMPAGLDPHPEILKDTFKSIKDTF